MTEQGKLILEAMDQLILLAAERMRQMLEKEGEPINKEELAALDTAIRARGEIIREISYLHQLKD